MAHKLQWRLNYSKYSTHAHCLLSCTLAKLSNITLSPTCFTPTFSKSPGCILVIKSVVICKIVICTHQSSSLASPFSRSTECTVMQYMYIQCCGRRGWLARLSVMHMKHLIYLFSFKRFKQMAKPSLS